MDIGDWLRSLGLERYEAAFRENEINETVLPNLTAEDLKDLGVGIVGHRRTLLDALAALRADEGAKQPITESPSKVETLPQDTAERRQVTVMFSDLVGSTALSARMDPEDLREVISAYQKCVAETVQPLRRVRGEVHGRRRARVLRLSTGARGRCRAGSTGGAGVGRSGQWAEVECSAANPRRHCHRVGRCRRSDRIGCGSGAADRRRDAEPRGAPARHRRAEQRWSSPRAREGFSAICSSLRTSAPRTSRASLGRCGPGRRCDQASAEGRFEALHASGLTALVGREEELELLSRRWARAKTGEGQVVLLSGEAGIGKSRLTAALLERLAAEPHTRLRYFCSPQHTDSALYPIIGQMERAAGLAHDDTPQARLDKLDAVLAQTSTRIEDVALFAEMLSLPNDGRYPAIELTPEQRRQRTLEALTEQLAGLASQNPVLMIFEDAHWTDPTSLEAFGRTVDRIKTLPVLLIVTFRPEFNAPWAGRSHVTSLALNRLGEREAAAIIARLVGNKELPADVMAEIVERTDGIPLFVEEMTKAVLEAEGEGDARRTAGAVPSPALAVPASLHASLMARLDRLGPAKEVAQIGAAIGREFSHPLLAAVMRKPEAELGSALDRLIAAGLLFRQGVPPHATYLFKHALVQDAAYGTLLREPRRALHARIAETLESQFAEIAENQPELLARHCTEAGLIEKAAGLWGKAGQRSLERSALVEAVEQLTARARPDRDLARHARAASRRDQASGRAHNPTHPCQRVCCAGNQGGCGAGTSADRTS